MVAVAKLDVLRSIDFGDISGTYAAIGTPLTHLARIVTFTNNTEGDMLITTDNTRDEMFVAAGSYKLYDIQANQNDNFDDKYVLPIGLQFYVKQLTAPVSGSVYLEVIY